MAQVHLQQLRGLSGQQEETKRQEELATLHNELMQVTPRICNSPTLTILQTRSSLAEALASRDMVAKEREQLAEQYRSGLLQKFYFF